MGKRVSTAPGATEETCTSIWTLRSSDTTSGRFSGKEAAFPGQAATRRSEPTCGESAWLVFTQQLSWVSASTAPAGRRARDLTKTGRRENSSETGNFASRAPESTASPEEIGPGQRDSCGDEEKTTPAQALLSGQHEETARGEKKQAHRVRVGEVFPCLLAPVQMKPVGRPEKESRLLLLVDDLARQRRAWRGAVP